MAKERAGFQKGFAVSGGGRFRMAASALAIVAALAAAAPAMAQDEDDESDEKKKDEIVVTGTNIRGVENPTVPVISFSREDIDLSGATNLEQFSRIIPQNLATQSSETLFGGNDSTRIRQLNVTGFDLRGLGAGATLTLINGRRTANSGGAGFVDISAIPFAAIQSIDVLTDGASAIYGADAVAGVVNILTRRDFEGVDITASVAGVTEGNKRDYDVAVTGGHNWR
ncbi:MAG: TonB-dependent receptor plug domain-containing protein, partial [Amphiplicatus sp.]